MREKVNDGTVELKHIPSDQKIADGLTKALCRDKFVVFRDALGVEAPLDRPIAS